MTDALDLDQLEAIARAATQGEWRASCLYDLTDQTAVEGPDFAYVGDLPTYLTPDSPEQRQIHADAVHIAAFSPDTARALIAEIRRLHSALGYAEGIIMRTPYRSHVRHIDQLAGGNGKRILWPDP